MERGTSRIVGELQLCGERRPLELSSTAVEGADGVKFEGEVEIAQTEWGLTPFSTMMGAIALKDNLRVVWSTCCRRHGHHKR